jgi:hypothetical protein
MAGCWISWVFNKDFLPKCINLIIHGELGYANEIKASYQGCYNYSHNLQQMA